MVPDHVGMGTDRYSVTHFKLRSSRSDASHHKTIGNESLETYYSSCLHGLPEGMILQQSSAASILGIFLSMTVIGNCTSSLGLENKLRLNVITFFSFVENRIFSYHIFCLWFHLPQSFQVLPPFPLAQITFFLFLLRK